MSNDFQSLEATNLQLMAAAQRHDTKIDNLMTKNDFLLMETSHASAEAKLKLAKLEEKVSQAR